MKNLHFHTLLILNRLRSAAALREEQEIADEKDRGPDAGNTEHDSREDKRGEVANRRIRNSPAGDGIGGDTQPLPGSWKAAMTAALGRTG